MEEIAKKAFIELFPDKKLPEMRVLYSNNFKPYNANIRYYLWGIAEIRLSKRWKTVSEDILIGLMQNLMARVYKNKKRTMNMDLYENFTKNLHKAIPKTIQESVLLESFNRVNEKYFLGTLESPNLKWGKESKRVLGHYNYKSDTVTLSKIFQQMPQFIDYIVYHELLHKKHQFHSKNGRNYHHTRAFKDDENKFENKERMEKELSVVLSKKRLVKSLKDFFTT